MKDRVNIISEDNKPAADYYSYVLSTDCPELPLSTLLQKLSRIRGMDGVLQALNLQSPWFSPVKLCTASDKSCKAECTSF